MNGSVTIAPHVLTSLIGHAAQEVPGIARMGIVPAKHVGDRLRGSQAQNGVLVRVEGNVHADVYVVAQHDVNLLDLGSDVQAAVTNALVELVGLPVAEVNVVIQDVEAARG